MSRIVQSNSTATVGLTRDAARLFFDAQRCLLAGTICLDEAGFELGGEAVDAVRTLGALGLAVEDLAMSLTGEETAA